MRGLRSYRAACTIDFRDRGLVAIVGDTGAGKSSILEAITYVLYNATTWDQRAVGQLLSDGAQSMSVELEFQARDQVWSVHRALHRAAGRPSTHRLRCLSDPAAGEYDGEAAVNAQVERLLGMSYRAYLAAVVLPQGRFQTLLQETPARRTGILEGIFRLTDLRGVQAAARDLGGRAGVAIGMLVTRREALLPDPAGTARTLAAELESLRGRESALVALQAEAARTREVVLETTRRADALRGHASLVAGPDGPVAPRLADLVPLAAAVRAELADGTAREEEARRREKAAADAAAAAAEVGESVEHLVAAAELLAGVRRTLADLEADLHSAEHEQAQLDAAAAALTEAEAALPDLEARSLAARQAAGDATGELERQRELGLRVREALRSAREASDARDVAAAQERQRRQALPALEEEVAGCGRAAREAERELHDRRRELEEAQRRDAAAHAAEGLRSGDPCPVCGRPLTEAFEPPPAGALGPLQQALGDADAELGRRRAAETAAVSRLDEGERRLAEAVSRHEAAEQVARERLGALRLVAPAADLGAGDRALLGPIDERGRELAAIADGLAQAAEQARDRLRDVRAGVEAARGEHERRTTRLEGERSRIREQRARTAERLRALPRGLAAPEAARAADLDDVIAAAGSRLDAATRQRQELDGLRAEVARLATVRAGLQRRLQDQVESPRGLAMRRALELRLRVDDGLRALGRAAVEAAPTGAAIEVEVSWAMELDRQAAELLRHLEDAIGAGERAAAAATAELERRLTESGLANAEGLEEELRGVSRQIGRVQSAMEAAEVQIPRAADLDSRIASGVEVRDSLLELARLVGDSQFVGHVIERLQRQLLIVASQILGSMSGGAYGFAANFEIVDRLTNQPRPTRTLSGGETFLASLALALALVEIAARSGTQLDALFLDEGFGSLDASALDDALSALELQASAGRLVAVVSHVRAVAERIETVLEVTRTAAGSQAEWRGATERELMLAEELESRLLA